MADTSGLTPGNRSSIVAPAAILSTSLFALITFLLVCCLVWLMWRRYVLGKGRTTVIGYGTSKDNFSGEEQLDWSFILLSAMVDKIILVVGTEAASGLSKF